MSTVIDIAIGLALVFLLVSLLATGVQESLANAFNSRGKLLEQAVIQLLDGYLAKGPGYFKDAFRVSSHLLANRSQPNSLATQLLGHGLLAGLFQGARLPSYIPNEKFADALIDCLRRRAGEAQPTPEGLLWAVHRLPPSQSMYALETIIIASSNDLAMIRRQFMDWYQASMDRVSGWYTRAVRYRTFLIGLAVAMVFQIDAIHITQTLAQDPALRSHLVEVAVAQVGQTPGSLGAVSAGTGATSTPKPAPPASATLGRLSELSLPIGWSWCAISTAEKDGVCAPGFDVRKGTMLIAGWLIVALAASQGAPFWFNLIGQLITIRGTGRKPAPADGTTESKANAAIQSPSMPAATPSAAAALPPGITADDLRNVQAKLGIPATGVVDAATRDAVRSAQLRFGTPADGVLTVPLARQILK